MVAGGQAIVPAMAKAAAEVATNPNVPRMAGTVARTATTLGALGHGAYTGNLSEIVAAPLAGWQAGKGGYFLGKGLQAVARPVAAVLDAVAPFAQSLATIGGAQSFLDLAQMANPKRTDIGTLGVSVGAPRSEADKAAHPALVNMLAGKVQDGIAALMQYGLSRVDAVKAITDRMTASQSSAASRPAAAPAPPPGPPNTVADFLQRD
jgi:hypothetical protein